MQANEFGIFAKALKTYYPKDNLLPTAEAMELWFDALKDVPYASAAAFLKKWILTEKWSPTIADITQGCMEIASEPMADWGEAWADVLSAVRRYGYMNASRAKDSMSSAAWKAIEAIGGWQHLCESEDSMADRANFRTCYETYAKREKQDMVIPQALKETISNIRLGSIETKMIGGGK